ncbi:MAG: response regulator [Nitrosopumilaceae archaeon]
MKVLIVDDNKDVSELLSIYLKKKGFDNVIINDPRIVLGHIKEEKYDVVVLDISMPEISGIDIIKKLERQQMLRDQKIIILSAVAFTSRQVDNLLKKEGIHSCLKKPVRLNELLTAIAN